MTTTGVNLEASVVGMSSRASLVVELPRAPGARETRWAHLLSGPPAAESFPSASAREAGLDPVSASDIAVLKSNVAHLQAELATLKATVAKLCADLGAAES